jgi:hypothetical protein
MSQSEIERFAADLKSNAALRAEADRAQAGTSDATPLRRAAAFAASKGYGFTADELKELVKAEAKAQGKQLTDAELDGVAGGVTVEDAKDTINRSNAANDALSNAPWAPKGPEEKAVMAAVDPFNIIPWFISKIG